MSHDTIESTPTTDVLIWQKESNWQNGNFTGCRRKKNTLRLVHGI